MPPFLTALLARTGGFVPIVAAIGLAVLLTIIALLAWQNHSLQGKLASKERAIGQLQGAIELQNSQVLDWQHKSEAASKAAQEEYKRAVAGRPRSEATVAGILAKPAPVDPTLICKAADDLILETVK